MTITADRRRMIAKIHVAKKDLALTDDTYRGLVERITGHESSAKATDAQLHRLLLEFTRLGWNASKGTRTTSVKPWVRKIYAIWGELRPLLDAADAGTLSAFCRRQTKSLKTPDGIDKPEFLDALNGTRVIQGLEGWLRRTRANHNETEQQDA